MKQAGYLMIVIGFIAGALLSVVDELEVQWGYFICALIVGAIGVVLVQSGKRQHTKSEEKLTSNIQNIQASLSRITENITQLNAAKDSVDTYDMRYRIDELFGDDLAIFVQARESISHLYGLQAYADVMSYFASGERYLNRIWSASADGYIDEVNTYLDRAQKQFADALSKVRQLTTQ